MDKYKTMKRYINVPDFELKLESYRDTAKQLDQFYEIILKNLKGKDYDGVYYFYTKKIINLINDFNNLKSYNYVNEIMVESNLQLFTKELFENNAKDELRYSGKIENEKINLEKVEKLDYMNLFSPITNYNELLNKMESLNNLNDVQTQNIIRNDEIGIIDPKNEKYTYEAIDYKKIPNEIDKLLKFINQENFDIIDAIVTHIVFELIHPMEDGNGRFGRYFLLNILINKLDVDTLLIFNFSKNINDDKKNYYKYFELAENTYTKGDITLLIECLLEKIVQSLKNNTKKLNKVNEEYEKYFKISNSKQFNSGNKRNLYRLIALKTLYKYDASEKTRLNLQKLLGSNKNTITKNLKYLVDENLILELNDSNTNITYYEIKKLS